MRWAFRLLRLDNLGFLASSASQEPVAAGSADPQGTAGHPCQPKQKTATNPVTLQGPASWADGCHEQVSDSALGVAVQSFIQSGHPAKKMTPAGGGVEVYNQLET